MRSRSQLVLTFSILRTELSVQCMAKTLLKHWKVETTRYAVERTMVAHLPISGRAGPEGRAGASPAGGQGSPKEGRTERAASPQKEIPPTAACRGSPSLRLAT